MSGSDIADALKLATCLGDARKRVEVCNGTANAAPGRVT